jgi:transposase InsO family protein
MTASDRKEILRLVDETVADGARQEMACEYLGVTEKSVQRWRKSPTLEDNRRGPKTEPANKLSSEERAKVIAVATNPEFRDLSPHQIVPRLADRGEYLASEATIYRILNSKNLMAHRGHSKPREVARPRACEATEPCKLFSWDITYLRSKIAGQYYYLYLFLDVFSRKIVGWEVHDCESTEHSSRLLTKICLSEGIQKNQVTMHADNGGPMKGATMLVTMQRLGVIPSFSRPSVSNDNPFSESLFKTLKYCPQYPSKPFDSIEAARAWVSAFVRWYNTVHLHSAIGFTTPDSRHQGKDIEILAKRKDVFEAAKQRHPNRWSGETRNCERVALVRLNWLKTDEVSDRTTTSRRVS